MVNVDGLTDGSKVFAKDVVLPEGALCSTSRIRKSPSSPSRCRKMLPVRLLRSKPLRLMTLSEFS